MEYIFTDASFSYKNKVGGFAIVAPKWSEKYKGRWFSSNKIKIFHEKNFAVFCSACKCSDSSDAEKRALGIAFLLADEILKSKKYAKIEIITDSLKIINDIVSEEANDPITNALANIRKKKNIIVSKVKAHNGNLGNELADKWAKKARKKFEEENNMRMPFKSNNNYGNNSFSRNSRPNPFDGSTEMDIRTLTERVLNDENNIGFVTPEGKVMPRNMAFSSGNRNGIELVKQRIWGGEDFIFDVYDDNDNSNDSEGEDESFEPDEDSYPVRIFYSDEALKTIFKESSLSPDRETGGALIGSWQRDHDGYITVNVERATGPGSEAVRNSALFSPHMDYYRARVGYYREFHNWDYLGEWHKHPGNFDNLSGTDIETAHSLIDEEGWPLLLLPIVNNIDGRFIMENNIILSSQLGGEIMTHFDSVELDEDENFNYDEVTAYIDDEIIKNFRDSKKDSEVLNGVYNSCESYIFLDIPGLKNAAMKLIKDNGENLPVSGLENVLTVLVGDENVRCFRSDEGEIKSVKHVLIDTESTIYERNAGLTETKILHEKIITLIGCGSLGSTMAVSLARAGVGNFRLFDPDRLSPVNIARHQAGLKDLGRKKVEVVRDLILGINPAIKIETFAYDIVNDPEGFELFKNSAAVSDIIICTTDTDDSRERASSGIVQIYEPDSSEACFACHHNSILSESSKRNENIAYSEANDVRDLTIQPGLSAQINTVAEIATLRTIDSLMNKKTLPSLSLIYIDRQDENEERALNLNIRHLEVSRVSNCPVCGLESEEIIEGEEFNEQLV